MNNIIILSSYPAAIHTHCARRDQWFRVCDRVFGFFERTCGKDVGKTIGSRYHYYYFITDGTTLCSYDRGFSLSVIDNARSYIMCIILNLIFSITFLIYSKTNGFNPYSYALYLIRTRRTRLCVKIVSKMLFFSNILITTSWQSTEQM